MTTEDMLSVREWRDLARSRGKDLDEIADAVGAGDAYGGFSPNVDDILQQVSRRTHTLVNLCEVLGLPQNAKFGDILGAVRTLKERAINTPSEI